MTAFVLVHGAWHGGWKWRVVAYPGPSGARGIRADAHGLGHHAMILVPEELAAVLLQSA